MDFFRFFEIFEKYEGYKHGHVKLKRPKQLQEILDIARFLLSEIQLKSGECEIEEKQGKLEQLKSVLEMYVLLAMLCHWMHLCIMLHITKHMTNKIHIFLSAYFKGTATFRASIEKSKWNISQRAGRGDQALMTVTALAIVRYFT